VKNKDETFVIFLKGLFAILFVYALAMAAIALLGNYPLASKAINGFVAMFLSAVSLGTGYFVGRKEDQ
jgi:hypothetical protein